MTRLLFILTWCIERKVHVFVGRKLSFGFLVFGEFLIGCFERQLEWKTSQKAENDSKFSDVSATFHRKIITINRVHLATFSNGSLHNIAIIVYLLYCRI